MRNSQKRVDVYEVKVADCGGGIKRWPWTSNMRVEMGAESRSLDPRMEGWARIGILGVITHGAQNATGLVAGGRMKPWPPSLQRLVTDRDQPRRWGSLGVLRRIQLETKAE